MAHFQQAPDTLPRNPPAGLAQPALDVLARTGTYNLWEAGQYRLKVPVGNTTWKGEQARLVAVWGGDEAGGRLEVTPRDPIVTVTLLSETTVGPHVWVWIVQAVAPAEGQVRPAETQLEARTATALPGRPRGSLYAAPLPVTVLPETATLAQPAFAGGDRAATINAIAAECRRQGITLNEQIAYILATAEHESGFTPTREGSFLGAERGERHRRGLRYYPYYGRGYVQLTHDTNYGSYGTRLNVELLADPDLALQANIALFVLVDGMLNGRFTGARLSQFVSARGTDFRNARRVVNGLDRADHIAGLAQAHLRTLTTPTRAGRP